MTINKGDMVRWKDASKGTALGIVASSPREVEMKLTPKATSLKLCVDVLFDGKLHRNVPMGELEVFEI